MSCDRVIQDSDEDEPLIEDDFPATNSLIGGDAPEHHGHGDNAQAKQTAPDDAPEPALSVNFDQFLQSQDGQHAQPTSSQHQREERWIPSATDAGGGSIGAYGESASPRPFTNLNRTY